MKILIVEDDSGTVQHIRDIIRAGHLAWRIEDCDNLERAFETVESFEPHVILLDLNLPGSSPEHTLEAIPRLGGRNALVVLTGHTTPAIVAEAFRRGADECLDKQALLDPHYFIQAIRHGYERFMRRNNLSSTNGRKAVLQELTNAERATLAGIPALKEDVDELMSAVFTGDTALTKTVAVIADQMKRLDNKATLRTVLLILFLVFNALVTLYNAHEHANLPQLQVPNAPGD